MIQVRLLVLAASKLIFFATCRMLPSAAKTFVKQTERKPRQLSAFIVSSLRLFSLDETKQKPLLQRDGRDSLLLCFTAICSLSHTQRHLCVVFFLNAPLNVVFKCVSDSVYKMHSSNTWRKEVMLREALWHAQLSS
jgi:hypothetical protein